jgi:hypothetical protein
VILQSVVLECYCNRKSAGIVLQSVERWNGSDIGTAGMVLQSVDRWNGTAIGSAGVLLQSVVLECYCNNSCPALTVHKQTAISQLYRNSF